MSNFQLEDERSLATDSRESNTDNQHDSAAQERRRVRRLLLDTLIASARTTRRKGEKDLPYLKRLTHIFLQSKGLSTLDELNLAELCPKLSTLYLSDNQLVSASGLQYLPEVTHIYMEQNRLTSLNHLPVVRLTKLVLPHNNISYLQLPEGKLSLIELHMASQHTSNLPLGLCPSTIRRLAGTLETLNLSGCMLQNLEPLLELNRLQKLNISHNKVERAASIAQLSSVLTNLEDIDARGNPACAEHKYYEQVLARASTQLVHLDGKHVEQQHKDRLRSLAAHQHKLQRASSGRRGSGSSAAPIGGGGNDVYEGHEWGTAQEEVQNEEEAPGIYTMKPWLHGGRVLSEGGGETSSNPYPNPNVGGSGRRKSNSGSTGGGMGMDDQPLPAGNLRVASMPVHSGQSASR